MNLPTNDTTRDLLLDMLKTRKAFTAIGLLRPGSPVLDAIDKTVTIAATYLTTEDVAKRAILHEDMKAHMMVMEEMKGKLTT